MTVAPPQHRLPLLEREAALTALSRALAAARDQGQFAAVSGEAGIGKTSLLEAFAVRERQAATFFWGACEALDTPRPLGPLLDMAADLSPSGVSTVDPTNDVNALLATGAPRHQVFAAFATSIARRTPPPVVVFEDVHWADEATLDLLRYVSRRIHRSNALIVISWRADEVGADHPLHRLLGDLPASATHRVTLAPLSLDAVTHLAGDARHSRAHAVFSLTNGNPFFVTELLRGASHGAGLPNRDAVPISVREAILARRGRLSAEAREVLDLVSVVPARVELDLVRASLPAINSREICAVLVPVVDSGLLTFDGRALGFRHELTRLAVLESLPLLRVQEMHRTVLTALSAMADHAGVVARLVHHAVGAADRAAVQRYAPAAARQAVALGAHRQAVAHYRTALAWDDGLEPAVRAETLDVLAYECYLTGDMAAAREALTEAIALWRQLDVPRAIGRDLRWLSRLAWFLGNQAEATQHAMDALDVLAPLGEDEELAMALSNRSQLHMLAREHAACFALGARAIEMARRLGSIEVLSHALNNVGTSKRQGNDPDGKRLLEESLGLALDHDLHEHAARAFTNLSTTAIQSREYDYARRWIDRGISYSVERELESWSLYMLAWRARLHAETGHWSEAEVDAETVVASPRVSVVAKIPALIVLGQLHARQRQADASAILDEALALALPTGESQRLAPVRAARAEHALLQGRIDDARAEAAAGLAVLTADDSMWDWEVLRYLQWRAARVEQAARGACGERGSGTRDDQRAADDVCDGPYGMLTRGDWRAAADAWERLERPYERAEALAEGDVPAMEEALQAFLAFGAAPAADRVRQELRRVGVTRLRRGPRSSTRAHPAGLTRRESEILALLAANLSNVAIGERLFVSPKTVEHHVSAILAKLEVATRDEAVVEARRRGWLAAAVEMSAK